MEEPNLDTNGVEPYYATDELATLLKPSVSKEDDDKSQNSGVTYVTFLLCGLCTVFPWNVFITAKPYFDFKLDNNDTANSNNITHQYQDALEVFFGIGSQVTGLLMQLIMTSVIHRISLKIRMYIPLVGMLLIFLATAILTWIPVDDWVSLFFYFTVASVIVISVCAAIFQLSTFGLAGVFPKEFTHATMIGQGVGGLAVSAFEIFVLLIINQYVISGFIYFLCAMAVIFVTIFFFDAMTRQAFAAPYLNDAAFEDSNNIQSDKHKSKPPFLKIFSKIYVPAISVCLIFAVTLGNFPSVISLIESTSTNPQWRDTFFTPVVCFLFFNFWDFLGRTSSFLQIPSEKHMGILAVLAISRLAFYPLFAFCNIIPRDNTDVYFKHDAFPMVFVSLLGCSNGYLGSLCVMYGPKLVEPEHQETAGAIMSFFLVLGLAIGSVSALIVINII
ncbi:equilibrative nucleoside transporter 1-like [Apostichopus japonicus]|uniref:equilibrative nucleoside transporter 1-like n=1 Tax=Stichopus japonicus TaxID=307972 RepID=UPI003AB30384